MVNLQIIKSANSSYVFLGTSNKVIYSILINNIGDSRAKSVRVKDLIEGNASIIPKSVKVDGCGKNVLLGDKSIAVGTIEAGGSSIITYEVEISKSCVPNSIVNKVIVGYNDSSCTGSCNFFVEESNMLIIPVIDLDVKIRKMVNQSLTKVGDILSYTIIVRNDSNISIKNSILTDYLSDELELYPASVIINGKIEYLGNLEDIYLDIINPYSSIIIQFKAKVLGVPQGGNIKNSASLIYEYQTFENGIEIISKGCTESNEVYSRVLSYKC
ncbi:MAG: hypothetical protein ACRCTZ_05885 [Sarcina sp.]